MGNMDTEVTIARYSHLNSTDGKKPKPHIEIIAESADSKLGSSDLDIVLVNLLADKFNALPERKGQPDVRTNARAVKRL
jgi:molecular chaperone DnaK (HSP70)